MGRAVVFSEYGAASVLRISEIQERGPAADEILIKQEAIGVNYSDILYRSGQKKTNSTLKVTGFEAAGIIQEMGKDVTGFKLGQKVAYATAPVGAYREYRSVHKDCVVAVPEELDTKQIAACFFKGLTAHHLLFQTYSAREGDTILVHSAASGVGNILTAWAYNLGIKVIGTVGNDAKKAVAKKSGCMHVFNRNSEDWVQQVLDLTNGAGVHIVYDAVGRDTLEDSIRALSKFGFLILYGGSSGAVPTIDTTLIEQKSLFLSMPSMLHYKSNRMELVLTADEIFSRMKLGQFTNQIGAYFPLEQANKAHELIESGQSVKSVILVPQKRHH